MMLKIGLAKCLSLLLVVGPMLGLVYLKLSLRPAPTSRISNHTHILILSTWRSGSTFTGQLFNQHPDVFYMMEPAWHVWSTMAHDTIKILHVAIRDLVRSIFLCDMSVYDAYMPQQRITSTLFGWHMSRALCSPPACHFFKRHDIIPHLNCRKNCGNYPFDTIEKACKTYSHIVLKEVRILDLKVLFPLLRDPSLNLKILHLVRDPRAVLQSRKKTMSVLSQDNRILIGKDNNQKADAIYKVMEVVCQSQAEIYKTATNGIPSKLAKSYMMVRYEDIARDPVGKVREMYQFVNLPLTPEVKEWVHNITHGTQGGNDFVVTPRHAVNISKAWRTSLPFEEVRRVQDVCPEAMAMFGYRLLQNETEQKNILLDLELPLPMRVQPARGTV